MQRQSLVYIPYTLFFGLLYFFLMFQPYDFYIYFGSPSQLENDPGPLSQLLLPPGGACTITLSQFNRKISNDLPKESQVLLFPCI